MTKAEFAKKIAESNEISQKQAAAVIDDVFSTIMDTVAAGESFTVTGFGTFSKKHREARTGRNPATGETIEIAASDAPVFKAGKAFKEKVSK